jgi:hypothetical protein
LNSGGQRLQIETDFAFRQHGQRFHLAHVMSKAINIFDENFYNAINRIITRQPWSS